MNVKFKKIYLAWEESWNRKQAMKKEFNSIANTIEITSLNWVPVGVGSIYEQSVKLKVKGTANKHSTLTDKVVSHGGTG